MNHESRSTGNAALVEQSAAAAESLKAQAGKLAQVVGMFKLGSTSTWLARHNAKQVSQTPSAPPRETF